MAETFAKICYAYQCADDEDEEGPREADLKAAFDAAKPAFDAAMTAAGFSAYEEIGFDYYDSSIEFYGVDEDARLQPVAQAAVNAAGFHMAYVNHKDGWETHYSWWKKPFAPVRGWRRRWVEDPNATTTRSVGEKPNPRNAGYYEISYWPEGWAGQEKWKDTGYMRVVPDPLEVTV